MCLKPSLTHESKEEKQMLFLIEELWLALLESDTLLMTNHRGVGMTHQVAGQR